MIIFVQIDQFTIECYFRLEGISGIVATIQIVIWLYWLIASLVS